MKKLGLFAVCAALFLSLALSGCAAKAPDEKLYVLSRERDAVYLVGAKGSEKVMDVPSDSLLADVSGSSLWYATETSLIRLGLADGSRTDFGLAEDEYKARLLAFEDEAYIQLRDNVGSGKILRADAEGLTRVTGKTVCDRYPDIPFAVADGAVYYFSNGAALWREDAQGRTHLDIVRSPLYGMSVDRGRVYLCGADGCFSYDALTGGDERLELAFGSVEASELPRAVYSFEIIKTAAAHGGWLYWPAANPKSRGADDAVLLMAKRLSDGLTVEYAKMADVFGWSFDSVVTFGRQGFVVSDGYANETFRYIPYCADGKSAPKNPLGLPDASSVRVTENGTGKRATIAAPDMIDELFYGLKTANWKRGDAVAGEPADWLCRLEFSGETLYIVGPDEVAWDGSLWQTSDRTVIDLEPFERLFRPLPDKGTPPPDFTPAPTPDETPDVTPVPTPAPYNPDFEPWEWDESTSSVETVKSIFRHMSELRGIKSCEAVSVEYDEELTKINREALAGSDLAKSRGVSDERIMNDLEIVRAVYDIVYDDSVPHMMGTGRYEVIFFMLRDEETGFWNVWDNSSLADVPAETYEFSIAQNFTVGGVPWAADYETVKRLLGDAEELDNGMLLSKKGAEFFGQKADIEYVFAKVDGEARLNAVAVVFEPDFDKAAVVEAITAVLGEIDKTVVSASGDVIPVEEPLWKWHDEEKVGIKYLHTAAFAEYLYPGNRPVLEIIYNGLWS